MATIELERLCNEQLIDRINFLSIQNMLESYLDENLVVYKCIDHMPLEQEKKKKYKFCQFMLLKLENMKITD